VSKIKFEYFVLKASWSSWPIPQLNKRSYFRGAITQSKVFVLALPPLVIWYNLYRTYMYQYRNLYVSIARQTYFIIFKMNICFAFFWSYSYRFLMIISGYIVSFRATKWIGKHFVPNSSHSTVEAQASGMSWSPMWYRYSVCSSKLEIGRNSKRYKQR